MSKNNRSEGSARELEAARFLESQGYKIICRNWRTRFAEIDIIARDKETLCFIEVKFRTTLRFGSGFEAVTPAKQSSISRAALTFMREKGLLESKARFDVIAIDQGEKKDTFHLIRGAFEARE